MKTTLIPGVRLKDFLPTKYIKQHSLQKYINLNYIFKTDIKKSYNKRTTFEIGQIDKNLNFQIHRKFVIFYKYNRMHKLQEVKIS